METRVRHDKERSRYELLLDGEVIGVAEYYLNGDDLVFPHTEIGFAHRGQGLGAVLVRSAMDDVRATGRLVVPICWYVRDFLDANPDYQDLLAA
ncbi:MAG: GNAT family N-acetyltransferase [Acidimicrobiales bacterium]